MFERRSSLRRAAWIALASFLLPALAHGTRGAHADSTAPGPNFHMDFCTAVGPDRATPTSMPTEPNKDSRLSTHCPDCAGCASVSVAPPAVVAPWLAIALGPTPAVVTVPPVVTSIDVAATSPRGPPLRA